MNLVIVHGQEFKGKVQRSDRGVHFELNKGQFPEHVISASAFSGGQVFIENSGMTFSLVDRDAIQEMHDGKSEGAYVDQHVYQMVWLDGEISDVTYFDKESWYVNYFVGDEDHWAGGIPVYGSIIGSSLYKGIDVEFTQEYNNLKYNLIVQPNADITQIRWNYKGANSNIEDGELVVETSVGNVHEMRPIAYQMNVSGEKELVRCRYHKQGSIFSFNFPDGYDQNRELIIDPVLVFSSYSGSNSDNWGYTATFDEDDVAYGGGIVNGVGYPTTIGAIQEDHSGGWDVGIIKFNEDGSDVQYATYLGGTLPDYPSSMFVNSNKQLVVMGNTQSTNFPTTPGAFDEDSNGDYDIFISRFSEDGTELLASTLVGGSATDGRQSGITNNYGDQYRSEVSLDSEGNIYVASNTASTNFPVTDGVAMEEFGGGTTDAVFFKMDSALTEMIWCTYWGGSNNDTGYSLQVTSSGEVYGVGGTTSTNLLTTDSAYAAEAPGGTSGYIVKISEGLVDAATYVGTSEYDQIFFIEFDGNDNIWVTGQSEGAIEVSDNVYSDDGAGQFIQKYDPLLTDLLLSTTFGSDNGGNSPVNICQTAFLIDNCNRIFVSGWGGNLNFSFDGTNNMPVTSDAIQSTTDGQDFYIAVFDVNASDLLFGSFYGSTSIGEHVDGGTSQFSPKGIIYQAVCAGCGGSDAFPTTEGAWSETNGASNCNMAVFVIDLEIVSLQAVAQADPSSEGCTPFDVTFNNSGSTGNQNYWSLGDGTTSTEDSFSHTFTEPGEYTVMYVSINEEACGRADTTYLYVEVQDTLDLDPNFQVYTESCQDSLLLNCEFLGAPYDNIYWYMGDGETIELEDFTYLYDQEGEYTIAVEVTDEFCGLSETQSKNALIEAEGGIKGEIRFPNITTPNADQLNDSFGPYIEKPDGSRQEITKSTIVEYFADFELLVYDRWGKIVYSFEDVGLFWDGRIEEELAAEGVYYFIAKFQLQCGDTSEKETSGYFTMIR